jgi:DNA-binding PadR family transcriptional regulator
MTSLLDIPTKAGKQRGILSVYLLHSLNKKPKSGYELLSEIKEKTGGTWIPSKGSIYPILKHLEVEGLIKVKSVDRRSKHIFEVTYEGKKVLLNVKKHGRQMEEKFIQFRNLITEIISPKESEIVKILFDIRMTSISQIGKNRKEVLKVLETCLLNLKKLSLD